MNWLERKIFLYNVTIGLYMLDWWERCLVNTLLIFITFYLITLVKSFSVKLLVSIIGLFCKSSLDFTLSWLCSYSTINDTVTGAASRQHFGLPIHNASDEKVKMDIGLKFPRLGR